MKPKNMIYIAGPMTGIKFNNRAMFFKAEKYLRSAGWRVISPVRIGAAFGTDGEIDADVAIRAAVMAAELAVIPLCKAIYLLPGWNASAGACGELNCAIANNLEIVEAGDELG